MRLPLGSCEEFAFRFYPKSARIVNSLSILHHGSSDIVSLKDIWMFSVLVQSHGHGCLPYSADQTTPTVHVLSSGKHHESHLLLFSVPIISTSTNLKVVYMYSLC